MCRERMCQRSAADRRRIGMGCCSACVPTCSSWPEPITASLNLFSACMVAVLLLRVQSLLAESGLSRVLWVGVESKWSCWEVTVLELWLLEALKNARLALNPR